MSLEEKLRELQNNFAQRDLAIKPVRRRHNGRVAGFLLVKRKGMKIKMYQEKGHNLPHIHIDYGSRNHAASYSITSGERIAGSLPTKYDRDVSTWLEKHRQAVLNIWHTVQAGRSHEVLVAQLAADPR